MNEEIISLVETFLNSELFNTCSWLVVGCCVITAILAFATIVVALVTIIRIAHNVLDNKGWNRFRGEHRR